MVHAAKGGVVAAVGPSGTGKSTLIGKTTVVLLQQALLQHRRIVVTAHSNQAVVVLVQKILEQFRHILRREPFDEDVWVETNAARERRVDYARKTLKELEEYSLQQKCFEIVMKDIYKYIAYLKGLRDLEKGKLTPRGELREILKDEAALYEIVRSRTTITFAD